MFIVPPTVVRAGAARCVGFDLAFELQVDVCQNLFKQLPYGPINPSWGKGDRELAL